MQLQYDLFEQCPVSDAYLTCITVAIREVGSVIDLWGVDVNGTCSGWR